MTKLQNQLNTMPRTVFTVSQLTAKIKSLLEEKYSMIWISGEISNLRIPPSGHAYFTLKDKGAQISAVMFRGQMRQIKFDLDDGLMLVGLGRITVYEPRGNYQIILEYIEPQGIGALQVAFEQLKLKLQEEGLFSEKHKSALPSLPNKIGVITSPSGSVVQDILKVTRRRFFNIMLDIYPVKVQGKDAVVEVVDAIETANRLDRNDVLIIARGGGSLEDLAAFNSERVARAIFASRIPIVSAVGHETDYTIADFVADLRAPTPSAAAEMIVPVKADLQSYIDALIQRNIRATLNRCSSFRQHLAQLTQRIVHPGKKIQEGQLHIDYLMDCMIRSLKGIVQEKKHRLNSIQMKLLNNTPERYLEIYRSKIDLNRYKILKAIQKTYNEKADRLKTADALLKVVNPSAILKRGYSITRTLPQRKVVMAAETLRAGQHLEVQLAAGRIDVSVIRKKINNLDIKD
ncbi:MAG: exodeoxyribonuclease VII large subunit [Desulfobacteraceae bacterium]|jgi:exodeoxyribonuclease VII large subunit